MKYEFDENVWFDTQIVYRLLGKPGGALFASLREACGLGPHDVSRSHRRIVMDVIAEGARITRNSYDIELVRLAADVLRLLQTNGRKHKYFLFRPSRRPNSLNELRSQITKVIYGHTSSKNART